MKNSKFGFTLIELVLVILIMGIIASISSDLLTKIYQNYVQTRAITRLEIQTEIALDQITKRLHYRIKPAVIARDGSTIYSLSAAPDKDVELEWLSQSYESQRITGSSGFGWSGYTFLPTASKRGNDIFITSHGSDFAQARGIIHELSAQTGRLGVVFKDDSTDINGYGFANSNRPSTAPMSISEAQLHGNNQIVLKNVNSNKRITEFYDLIHTAYKLKVENQTLYLYYQYKPWMGETPRNGTAAGDPKRAIVAENVDSFRFKDEDNFIKIKLCLKDPTYQINSSPVEHLIVCKTKAIF